MNTKTWTVTISTNVNTASEKLTVQALNVQIDTHGNLLLTNGGQLPDVVLVVAAGEWFAIQQVNSD